MKDKHIEKISTTYLNKNKVEKFSTLIDLEEIDENDYNLNVSRYIDILPEEEPVDVNEYLKEIEDLTEEREKLEKEFKKNMEELGYE